MITPNNKQEACQVGVFLWFWAHGTICSAAAICEDNQITEHQLGAPELGRAAIKGLQSPAHLLAFKGREVVESSR